MNQQPLFYKNIVPLNKGQHQDLYLQPGDNYKFANETNSLYIAAIEFGRAARVYPIVFGTDADGQVFPVVLLGLKQKQNLFVDKKGKWDADYIPAYTRRYPFILANISKNGEDQYTVCIDEGFAGFNKDGKGQALFDDDGNQSPVLQQAVDFLKDYQKHIQISSNFCKHLAELDVLEPVQANIEMKSGDKFAIGGFRCVSRDKLKQLPPDTVKQMLGSGQLELIHAHMLSLNNIQSLMERMK